MSRSAERAARNYIRQQLGIDYSIVVVGSAAGVIQDPNIPGNVLVRIKASNGFMMPFSVGKPVSKVPLTVGKAVELEYKRKKLRIAGLDNDGIITAGGDPLTDTNDTDFNKQEYLATLGVTQTQPASTTVKVKAWNPIVNGTAYEFPGGEIDIATAGSGSSSLIPTSGNMARIVIFVKNDYVTLEAKSSTPRGMTDVILSVADTNEAIALRTAGSTPAWAIDLFNAQATITQGDIQNGRDLRNLVNNSESSGTMTSFSLAGDSGTPQSITNGNTLTVEGGTGIDTVAAATDKVTVNIDSSVAAAVSASHTQNTDTGTTGTTFQIDSDNSGPKLKNSSGNLQIRNAADNAYADLTIDQLTALNQSTINGLSANDDLTYSVGASATRYLEGWIQSLYKDNDIFPVIVGTGYTAVFSEIGYLTRDTTYGVVYKNDPGASYANVGELCVVVSLGTAGTGAAGTTIWVAQRGRVTVKLNANCAIGDYLYTSSTAGQAAVSTTMRSDMFAIAESANSGGAGGTCTARLYTQSQEVLVYDANDVYSAINVSTSAFVSTISGAPSATSVVYGAVTSGAENVIAPGAANLLGRFILHNTTRGTSRVITAVNTGTNTITTESTTDAWANGDTITIESQTVTTGATQKAIDITLASQSVIPLLAREVITQFAFLDTAAASRLGATHPFESYSNQNNQSIQNPAAGSIFAWRLAHTKLINRKYCALWTAGGAGTAQFFMRLAGYVLAVP